MDPYVHLKSLVTILILAAMLMLIALPLMRGKIRRGGLYGFKTRTTLSSDEIWFDVNAYFGRAFFKGAIATMIAMILVYAFKEQLSLFVFMRLSFAALVVPAVVAVLLTFRHLHVMKAGKR